MLPASQRLSRVEFSTVFKNGRRFHSEHFTLVYDPTFPTKASVVVSKKVAKLAVTRNLLRRLAYATVRSFFIPATSGGLIVLYKVGTLKVSRHSLTAELTTLLAKIPKSR
jgi:ribonuclease P protein component